MAKGSETYVTMVQYATWYTGCNIHTRQTPNLLVHVKGIISQSKSEMW